MNREQRFLMDLFSTENEIQLNSVICYMSEGDMKYYECAITQQRNHIAMLEAEKAAAAWWATEPTPAVIAVQQKEVNVPRLVMRKGKHLMEVWSSYTMAKLTSEGWTIIVNDSKENSRD